MARKPTEEEVLDSEYGRSLSEWATRYDAYTRLGANEVLDLTFRPFSEDLAVTGRLSELAGIDLLKGWAFSIAQDHESHRELSPLHRCDPTVGLIVQALLANPSATPDDLPPIPPDGIAEFDTNPRTFQQIQFYVSSKAFPLLMLRIHAGPDDHLGFQIIDLWDEKARAWTYARDHAPQKVGKNNATFTTKSKTLGTQKWELINHSEVRDYKQKIGDLLNY